MESSGLPSNLTLCDLEWLSLGSLKFQPHTLRKEQKYMLLLNTSSKAYIGGYQLNQFPPSNLNLSDLGRSTLKSLIFQAISQKFKE